MTQNVKETQYDKHSLIGEDNHRVKTAFSNCSTQAANWLEIKTNEQLPHQWTSINACFLYALQLKPNFYLFNQSE